MDHHLTWATHLIRFDPQCPDFHLTKVHWSLRFEKRWGLVQTQDLKIIPDLMTVVLWFTDQTLLSLEWNSSALHYLVSICCWIARHLMSRFDLSDQATPTVFYFECLTSKLLLGDIKQQLWGSRVRFMPVLYLELAQVAPNCAFLSQSVLDSNLFEQLWFPRIQDPSDPKSRDRQTDQPFWSFWKSAFRRKLYKEGTLVFSQTIAWCIPHGICGQISILKHPFSTIYLLWSSLIAWVFLLTQILEGKSHNDLIRSKKTQSVVLHPLAQLFKSH